VSLSEVPAKEFFNSAENSSPKSLTNQDTVAKSLTNNNTATMSTVKDFFGKIEYREFDKKSDIACLANQIQDKRRKCNLTMAHALFIVVAWIVKPSFRFFKLCPEVVWVDVTSHSNNKRFHLLTFLSRLLTGKQIVWLWIFIPNQQRFNFRWVFQEAIPTLIPQWSQDLVVFFMKDADPQQGNEILSSMSRIFVIATEGTCGFHVITMSWKKNVPSCHHQLSPTKIKKWSSVVHQIHNWVYSWMNPGNVKDHNEYKISKFLLEKFI
jgi:hypothetical protein